MKEIVLNYTQYNVWANKIMVDLLKDVSAEDTTRELGGSFGTIRKTIVHIWLAEDIWMQRLQMAEHAIPAVDDETKSLAKICYQWIKSSNALMEFTEKIHDERGLQHEFHYQNIKGEHFKSKVWECLHHVCNHSAFHRGQIINYLRQVGVTKIPSTDFITFCRSGK